jgi:hypothetical protein
LRDIGRHQTFPCPCDQIDVPSRILLKFLAVASERFDRNLSGGEVNGLRRHGTNCNFSQSALSPGWRPRGGGSAIGAQNALRALTRSLGRVSNVAKEQNLPSLQETRVSIALAPVKPAASADLGAPLVESTSVKKGRAQEHLQPLDDGKIGRRFQGFRITAIKTIEGGLPTAKVFVTFEVFGDNTAAPDKGVGFDAVLFAGETPLTCLSSTSLFLPYANFWYPNSFVFDIPLADFDQTDRMDFIAKPEPVRTIEAP